MANDEQYEKRVAEIQRVLQERDTEDLLEIWAMHDQKAWTHEAFSAIHNILLERLGEVPPQESCSPAVDYGSDTNLDAKEQESLARAAEYLDLGMYVKAQLACEAVINYSPDLAVAYNYLGLSYDGLEDLENAIAAYAKAIQLDPNFQEAQQHLYEAELEREQASQLLLAEEQLEQAVDNVSRGELEAALQACELAIQTASFFAIAHNYRGMILEELEQIEDAIDAYYEAVRLNPELYAARENLANARLKWERDLFQQLSDETSAPEDEPDEILSTGEIFLEVDMDEYDETETIFERYGYRGPAFYLDEPAFLLRGWPGYRTRPGLSGFDPLDSDFELAHIEGLVLRQLFTGKFRTENPIYLFMMIFWGVIGCLSLKALIGHLEMLCVNVVFIPAVAVGAALLWNALLSILDWGIEDDPDADS